MSTKPRLIQRHDQFFKRLLEQPSAAGALIRERLPVAVAACLAPGDPDWSTAPSSTRRCASTGPTGSTASPWSTAEPPSSMS
ncbi:hypothetical protein [Skermanella stibiiresistens]|uniref:hypothetical protein n=1 Tax=Skermanella stibiiresistens TaxID=913326 RepID=UPI0012F9C368|nr:hypothetical protein [Skermanella stibiiresistens]